MVYFYMPKSPILKEDCVTVAHVLQCRSIIDNKLYLLMLEIPAPKEIIYYEKENGETPVKNWFDTLDSQTLARIESRILRLAMTGNYGLYACVQNIKELKFTFGSGYRIYFAEVDNKIILLLNAGDKSTQKKDIKKAKEYFEDYLNREEL